MDGRTNGRTYERTYVDIEAGFIRSTSPSRPKIAIDIICRNFKLLNVRIIITHNT